MSNITEVTDQTFEQTVLKSAKPVLVDYWADWCSPCKQMSPILDELSAEFGDRVSFVKMDTNTNPVVPASQGVMSLPTLQVFVDGQVVKQVTGGKTRNALVKLLDEFVN
ncbi:MULTISPECIES: thioredoxin [Aestuariimicrobium]|uniref:thioredoxin n=1 Tax=Aestuariimicrobium TaxID=396388 RepID=UPI0003B54CDF|nr:MULTISPECIES: thioredoxin [Aestuariimicrobium]CAI9403734.1 Thioredoxin 1 [Aestuariimicrobium sp. T2.26MG-19.2B]